MTCLALPVSSHQEDKMDSEDLAVMKRHLLFLTNIVIIGAATVAAYFAYRAAAHRWLLGNSTSLGIACAVFLGSGFFLLSIRDGSPLTAKETFGLLAIVAVLAAVGCSIYLYGRYLVQNLGLTAGWLIVIIAAIGAIGGVIKFARKQAADGRRC